MSSDHVRIDVLLSDVPVHNHMLSEICNHVMQRISSSLSDVIARLNYDVGKVVHQLAFLGPLSTCIQSFHLAYVRFNKNAPCALKCSFLKNRPAELPVNYNIWFDEVSYYIYFFYTN